MTFSYILDDQRFICGAPVSNGGNILKWLQKNFIKTAKEDFTDLFRTIEVVPAGSNGLICLPYLYGERSPVLG